MKDARRWIRILPASLWHDFPKEAWGLSMCGSELIAPKHYWEQSCRQPKKKREQWGRGWETCRSLLTTVMNE
eukprot:731577-Amphidinium_carterae.2